MPKQASAMKKRAVRGSRSGRPIMALLDLLGRRWTLRIIWELRDDRSLTSPLRAACDDVSPPCCRRAYRSCDRRNWSS